MVRDGAETTGLLSCTALRSVASACPGIIFLILYGSGFPC
jgi:hypothetical protein